MKNFDLEPFDEETKILLQYVNDNFLIDKVEKVEFEGTISLHEILTYNVKKLYIAKSIYISDNRNTDTLASFVLFDYANVAQFDSTNSACYWDGLLNIAKYLTTQIKLKNILFSRVQPVRYDRFKMIGYRITLQ